MAYILIDVRGLGSHSGTSNARSAQTSSDGTQTTPHASAHTGSGITTAQSATTDPLLYSGSVSETAASNNYNADLYPFLHTSTLQQNSNANVQTVSNPTAANSHAGTRPEATSIHSGTSTGTTRTTTTTTDDNQTLIDYTNAAFEAALQEQQAAQQAEQRYTSIQQQPTAATTDPGTNNGGKKWPWIVAAIGAAGLLGYAIFGGKKKKDK